MKATRTFDLPSAAPPAGTASPAGTIVNPHTLTGTWVNYDETSRGIAKLVITPAGQGPEGTLDVRIHSSASAELRDWGTACGKAFAAGVDGGDGVGFRAHYNWGFMATLVVAYINLRLLVVDTYNSFQDGSGRSRYFMRDHFYQAD